MTQPAPAAAGDSARAISPVAAMAALLVIGGLLMFFTLRAGGDEELPMATPTEPLRVLPVLTQVDGPCTATAPDTFETAEPLGCLTVDLDGGITMEELREVTPEYSTAGGSWTLAIEPTPDDAQAFSDLTARLAPNSPPGNMVAMIMEDMVLTAVQILEPIDPGPVHVTGFASQEEAVSIAERLGYRG